MKTLTVKLKLSSETLPQLRKQRQVFIDTMDPREEDSNLQKAKALATNQTQSGITSEHDEACQAISNTLRTQNKELREKVKICSKKKGKVQPLKTEPAANNVGKGMPDDAEEVHVVLPCLALCVMLVQHSCTSRYDCLRLSSSHTLVQAAAIGQCNGMTGKDNSNCAQAVTMGLRSPMYAFQHPHAAAGALQFC